VSAIARIGGGAPLITTLVVVNVLVHLTLEYIGSTDSELRTQLYGYFGLLPPPYFGFTQIVTYAFLHSDWTHLFFNMFGLWMFGKEVERYLGTGRLAVYYLICVIGAAIFQLGASMMENSITLTVGASGGVFGILLAFGMLFPNRMILLLIPPIPMKAKWAVILFGVVELLFGVTHTFASITHFAHLGGMVFGFFLILFWRRRRPRVP